MYSSKIIRKGGEPQLAYTLEPLTNVRPAEEPDVFRAIQFGIEEAKEAEQEELPPPPPTIPEAEALRLIEQARTGGEQEGKRQVEAQLAMVNENFAQALLAIGTLRGQLLHEAEEDLLKLSVLIARKVLLKELSCDPGALAGLVHKAVELAADEGEVVVRLNPEDHALAVNCREFQELLSDNRCITLKGDPAIGRAGCLVETVRGNIDGGLDAQLEEIFRGLTEEKSARREEPGA